MAAPKEMVGQVDELADSLVESVGGMQTAMALLHSTVGVLLNSMTEILKSMAEMKAALQLQPTTTPAAPTTESQVTAVDQDLPVAPKKQSIAVDNTFEEKEARYTYLKKIQIEMPVFDGQDVDSWIPRAERYFRVGNFTDAEKLRLAYLSVDGEALSWFNLWEHREPFLDWSDFKSRLLDRFGVSLESGPYFSRLLSLEQVDSVIDYLGEYEKLASQTSGISDDILRIVFVKGLKQEIKNTLPLFQPKGLNEAITKARILEDGYFCRWMNPPVEADDTN